MVEPAKNRMRNNISEPLDRACAGRVLPKRNVSSHFIIRAGIFPTGLPSPIGGEAHSMPTHDSLGLDDGIGIKDARAATIEPNAQRAIGPTQIQSTWCALLQDVELMSQYQDFGL
jgi:hypothetical protein